MYTTKSKTSSCLKQPFDGLHGMCASVIFETIVGEPAKADLRIKEPLAFTENGTRATLVSFCKYTSRKLFAHPHEIVKAEDWYPYLCSYIIVFDRKNGFWKPSEEMASYFTIQLRTTFGKNQGPGISYLVYWMQPFVHMTSMAEVDRSFITRNPF